ncbi:cysteine-rich receptor-like protein kinase 10 [Neltuma alba]|uniref:cysteine-rich receptor-like protein kinase 10 n=1 Tax=Neltuma alba TaxID=207710 RepID=UPI0010A3A0EC|nr:cysteine-rich receptor-like protein kinase 10 [Prosopis alba]
MPFNIIILLLCFIGFLHSSSAQVIGRNSLHPQCSTHHNFTANSTFDFNLNTLFSSLTSNETAHLDFYNTTVDGGGETIYGLFMCRGDVNQDACHQCVVESTAELAYYCRFSKAAVNWLDPCLVRYSQHNFFSTVDRKPKLKMLNTNNVSNQAGFMNVLMTVMNLTADEAAKPALMKKKSATKAVVVDIQTLYVMVQCTPDLSPGDCRTCLSGVIGNLPWCCEGKIGGRVAYPSCFARYELYMFFNSSTPLRPVRLPPPPPPPPPPPAPLTPPTPSDVRRKRRLRTIVIAVASPVGAVILLCFSFYLSKNQIKKIRMAFLMQKYFGSESNTLEPLQFSLATIEAATNKFSQENCLGQGGFGQVYKGILSNGQEIAVKRLSKSSGQGVEEFKNEVLLIARLQHRNLVALLGFCIEEQEKILIYEYVPNKSLDYFLFGSQKIKVLNWEERCKIIGGVARGILYLHDYARVKIIHRDLKPSNILLDNEMNPKISDFGMARMVGIHEIEESTSNIVGTYGYMSPEYAMFGQYSEKSDVFSFGVIVLEMISGRKITSSQDQSHGLLNYAWNQWNEEKILDVLDSSLNEPELLNEVDKCIQIGLLCVQENPEARPSMATVVSYLSNDSIQLPFPQEPAFFLEGQMELNTDSKESINEMSISEFYPR